MSRIAVVGASGFVGAALVEHLLDRNLPVEVVPLIHSSGNAWRLARRGLRLYPVNLLARGEIEATLVGCTHVVNCSRGDDDVMLKGLGNLLAASQKNKVERFIHLSSVLVYGDPPRPDSVHEQAHAVLTKGTYGWIKHQQDHMVRKACHSGLPSLILCPPNISGPYSPFLLRLIDALRANAFALLEDGQAPCNLVDVTNLAHAIEIALTRGTPDGKRVFILDGDGTTWRQVITALLPVIGNAEGVPSITREELLRLRSHNGTTRVSVIKSAKHFVSRDVRAALRQGPLWAKIYQTLGRSVQKLGKAVESQVRLAIAGPLPIPTIDDQARYEVQLCAQQLRGVRHEIDLAEQELGYGPLYSFAASMQAFRAWYRDEHGMETDAWDLLRQLYYDKP